MSSDGPAQSSLRRPFFVANQAVFSGCWKFSPGFPQNSKTFPPSAPTCPRNGVFRALRGRLRTGLLQSSTATEAGLGAGDRRRGRPRRPGSQDPVTTGRRRRQVRKGRFPGQVPDVQTRKGRYGRGPIRTGGTEPPAREGTRKRRLQPAPPGARWPRPPNRGARKATTFGSQPEATRPPATQPFGVGDGRLVLLRPAAPAGNAFSILSVFPIPPRPQPARAVADAPAVPAGGVRQRHNRRSTGNPLTENAKARSIGDRAYG